MGLTRGVKFDLRRTRNKFLIFGTFVLFLFALLIARAFGTLTTTIPFEVIWSDTDPTLRPSITVRLMNGNNEIDRQTLTSANVDPNDPDKWLGSFTNVTYDPNATYSITEDSVTGYTTTVNMAPSFSAGTITNTSSTSVRNGTTSIGDVNIIWMQSTRDQRYYMWTLDPVSNDILTDLVAQANTASNMNITMADLAMNDFNSPANPAYRTGLNIEIRPRTNQRVTIQGTEGAISVRLSSGATGISTVWHGKFTVEGDTVTIDNVEQLAYYTLTIRHILDDGTEFSPIETYTLAAGSSYTANPVADPHYSSRLAIVSDPASGIISGNVDVIYIYTENDSYNVIYSFTGNVLPPSANTLLPPTTSYYVGETVHIAADPTASGYRFLGWSETSDFTMPANDVTITGSWEQFNGYFTPAISKQVVNSKPIYRVNEQVEFEITVTNNESYTITNVTVEENLQNAVFTTNAAYTLQSANVAIIPSLASGASVTLYATYTILDDVTATVTNTTTITAATAANYYYLDNSSPIQATATFNTQSWQDAPIETGINTSSSTTLYTILLLGGAIGLVASVVMSKTNNNKERKR